MAGNRSVSVRGGNGEFLRIDATDLSSLLKPAKGADKAISKRLRAEIRKAAKPIVSDMQKKVLERPRSGGGRKTGRIAATKTVRKRVSFEEDGQTVTETHSEKVAYRISVRQAIAKGIGVKVSASKTRPGVSIVASPRHLPPERRSMVKAYNLTAFRHPVFGDRSNWDWQLGNPYFGAVAAEHANALRAAVHDAIQRALKDIASQIK